MSTIRDLQAEVKERLLANKSIEDQVIYLRGELGDANIKIAEQRKSLDNFIAEYDSLSLCVNDEKRTNGRDTNILMLKIQDLEDQNHKLKQQAEAEIEALQARVNWLEKISETPT